MLAPEQGQNETNIKTSAQRNRIRPTLLFAVFLLMGLVISIQGEDDKPQQTKNSEEDKAVTNSLRGEAGIRYIQDKLEKEALSMDQLMEFSREYESWPEGEKTRVRQSPELTLVIDFAIIPMRHERVPNPRFIYAQYNRFKKAYISGAKVGKEKYALLTGSTEDLCRKIKKDEHLVISDFVDAREEMLSVLEKMNELCHKERLYQNLDHFEALINFCNEPSFKPLFYHVFPAMKTSSDVDRLKSLYLENLTH